MTLKEVGFAASTIWVILAAILALPVPARAQDPTPSPFPAPSTVRVTLSSGVPVIPVNAESLRESPKRMLRELVVRRLVGSHVT